MHQITNPYKLPTQYGFSGLELMGMLAIIAIVLIASINILDNFRKNKEYNKISDQILQYQLAASRYITDNYRKLNKEFVNGDNISGKFINYTEFESYVAAGMVSHDRQKKPIPCLYLFRLIDNANDNFKYPLNAYLIMGSKSMSSPKQFPYLELIKTILRINANSGILSRDGNRYIVKSSVHDSLIIDSNKLINSCGFQNIPNNNSLLFIDLARDKNLYAAKIYEVDTRKTIKEESDIALANENTRNFNEQSITMQAHIYFDMLVQESTSGQPALHRYLALDFGEVTKSDGGKGRIQIMANAPQQEIARNSSQLKIDNAGLEAGVIAPKSHSIEFGARCNKDEIGKILRAPLRRFGNAVLGGQLQCAYNPSFCGETGYCYIFSRSMNLDFHYSTKVTSATCEFKTRLTENQPADGVDNQSCQIGNVIQIRSNCYLWSNFCLTLNTYCPNSQGGMLPVRGIKKISCTTRAGETFIDNYRP